jgi:hypothetical protein
VETISVNGWVIAVATAALSVVGLIGAVVPALNASHTSEITPGPANGRTMTAGHGEMRTAGLLVIAQIALVLPLLVAAMPLARTFSTLTRVNPGFRAERVLTLHLAIPRTRYEQDVDLARFCGRIVESVTALPGVESAGMVNRRPLVGSQVGGVTFEKAATPTRCLRIGDRQRQGTSRRWRSLFARDGCSTTRTRRIRSALASWTIASRARLREAEAWSADAFESVQTTPGWKS